VAHAFISFQQKVHEKPAELAAHLSCALAIVASYSSVKAMGCPEPRSWFQIMEEALKGWTEVMWIRTITARACRVIVSLEAFHLGEQAAGTSPSWTLDAVMRASIYNLKAQQQRALCLNKPSGTEASCKALVCHII
jgi:hypothetical protein